VIARNLYLHELRHSRRKQPLNPAMASADSVEADAEVKQELARVREAMARLPEADRCALLLRVVEGLPYEEIGAILRISIAAAKVKVHRARLRLGTICHESLETRNS
jgi:RNA polymerase sigma-70 factor, ECF subfamily